MIELELPGGIPPGLDLGQLTAVVAVLNNQKDLLLPSGVINAQIADDARLKELNTQYAGDNYATDVLSFSYIEDGGEPIDGVLGELAISLEMAKRQAKDAGTDVETELALLCLHGVLHILGFDHQVLASRQEMDSLQGIIMRQAVLIYRDFKWLS